jgi:Ca2+-binding EF-hand superfamily protein
MPVGEKTFERTPAIIDPMGRLVQEAATNAPSALLYLDRRFVRPLELGVELTGATKDLVTTYDAARKGWGLGMEFLPTPVGLAILITEGAVLMWVPRSEVDRALSAGRQHDPQSERFGYAQSRRFDHNQDGYLDYQERRNMRRDLGSRREQAALVEAAIATALTQHRATWDGILADADKNRDGKLSSFELAAAATSNPAVFVGRLRGVNGSLAQAMRPYDLDSDLMLNRDEFLHFLADPRLVAEVNRSPDWVIQFGLKPEECDTNDNGVLEDSERLLANQLIRERSAGRRPQTN